MKTVTRPHLLHFLALTLLASCAHTAATPDSSVEFSKDQPSKQTFLLSRSAYQHKMYGFWLGQNIANLTGRVTEMDKVGDVAEFKTLPFYTMDDWGKPDLPAIWGEGKPSDLSPTIDFVFRREGEIWDADDDTDLEYMYQHLLQVNETEILTAEQIQAGWLKHMRVKEENFLWGSNQIAFDLMREGLLPPDTSDPEKNENCEMIDAQLTTELFGLLAPGRPDVALKMADLPIRTTARGDAQWIARFYVVMHSLAPVVDDSLAIKEQIMWLAETSREMLPEGSYSAKMYEFVKQQYEAGKPWEEVRDMIYQRYQVEQADGYDIPGRNMYCGACFAAGINHAAGLLSLFYGEGDLLNTIKIGTLAGWDSDNPTSTWGGLIGFLVGKDGVEKAFGTTFSNRFNIHHTRQGFPKDGIDTLDNMADTALIIIDRVVVKQMGGHVDKESNAWSIPIIRLP